MITQLGNHRLWYSTVLCFVVAASISCSDDSQFDFPIPSEPLETSLYDLIDGPIDRASAFNVVAGRGVAQPRSVRVDQTEQWDVAFAVLNDEPVWLPRGFFDTLEPSSGILELARALEEIVRAPSDRDLYEMTDPLPVRKGRVYVIRSRPDPLLTFTCRIFAVLEVEAIDTDPARVTFRYLWNPNCDDRDLSEDPAQ